MKLHRLFVALGMMSALVIRSSAEEAPTLIEFVRPLGMGGAFTAVADDHNVFAFNPAGMVQRTGAEVTVLDMAVGMSADFIEGAEYLSDHEDQLTNFDDQTPEVQAQIINDIITTQSQLDNHIYIAGDVASFVSGPRFFGLPFHGGFGALAVVDGTYSLGANTVPNISYHVNTDAMIPLSLAKRFDAPWIIPGRIGLGFTGKFIRRAQIDQERQSVLVLDDLEAPPAAIGRGVGSDLGLLYQPTDRINVGLMVRDFMGTKIKFDALEAEKGYPAQAAHDSVIRPRTNIGVALMPAKLLWLVPTGNRLTLAADVRDIAAPDEHIVMEDGTKKPFGEDLWTHVHLGAEFKYWFLRLRGGAYQGYPSFGLGLDLPVVKLDYAFYSRELGARAGDRREENHIVSIALKFGTNYTESRERIRGDKALKKQAETAVPSSSDTPSTPAETQPTQSAPAPSGDVPQ